MHAIFYIRVPRARSPRGQNVAAIALDRRFLGTIIHTGDTDDVGYSRRHQS